MKPILRIGALFLLLLCLRASVAFGESAAVALTLRGGAGQSLADLAQNEALQSLTLVNCPAADLHPLAGCKRLRSLSIVWENGFQDADVYDLAPLAQCARLTSLTLQGACVNDLTALSGVPALTALTVSALAAEDYTPIAALKLKTLSLSGAPGDQVAAVFTAAGGRLERAVIGDCTLTPAANAAILKNKQLASLRFVNTAGIDTDAAAWTRLEGLTALQMENCPLDGLEFLSNFVSTVVVRLDSVTVDGAVCGVQFDKYFLETDTVPSAAMLDFLGGSGRQWLYAAVAMAQGRVDQEVIEAFSAIGSLLSLEAQAVSPDAWNTAVWSGFPKLEQLRLSRCDTVDLGFLSQLPALRRFTVSHAAITGGAALGRLPQLTRLTLLACELDDWSFLDRLTSLSQLTVADCNGPASLDFIQKLSKVTSLALENAPITDLAPLTGHSLQSLYVYGCPIADYAPLGSLAELRLLSCSENAALPPLACRVVRRRFLDTGE